MQENLPALISRAAQQLAGATTAAEVLEARETAGAAYDLAKRTARLARAKQAHDDILQRTLRAQADALAIEVEAKRRLADEYDAAQDRGEVARQGKPSRSEGLSKTADLGLSYKEIHEARKVREYAAADTQAALDRIVDRGDDPTRANLRRELEGQYTHRTQFTGGNDEWYTPARYVEMAREVMGGIDLDPASSPLAQQVVKATRYFTIADDGLAQEWTGRIWLNPPYSRELLTQFVDKICETDETVEAIVLTHAYTDVKWFQKLWKTADETCFPDHRIAFINPVGELANPTQGQAFFYFGPNTDRFRLIFSQIGVCRN